MTKLNFHSQKPIQSSSMSSAENSEQQPVKKRSRSEVTMQQLTDFLQRPTLHVKNLNRNLRKSYDQNYFKDESFNDFRELYKLNKNNTDDCRENTSEDQNSNDSQFSLHNDKKTLKKRKRQKQLRKMNKKAKEEEEQQQQKSQPKPAPKISATNLRRKKASKEVPSKDKSDSVSSSSSSSNTSKSESSEQQNSENNESEQNKSQKSSEQNSKPAEEQPNQAENSQKQNQDISSSQKQGISMDIQEAGKENPIMKKEQRLEKDQYKQSESVEQQQKDSEASSMYNKPQQEQSKDKKDNKMISEQDNGSIQSSEEIIPAPKRRRKTVLKQTETIVKKVSVHNPRQKTVHKYPKQYRLLFNTVEEADKMLTDHPRSKKTTELNNSQDQNSSKSSSNKGKQSKIGTKSKKKLGPLQKIKGREASLPSNEEKQYQNPVKIQIQPQKATQCKSPLLKEQQANSPRLVQLVPKALVLNNNQKGESARRGVIYRVQPSKRYHNLQLCQKVIVESMFFRSHINPPKIITPSQSINFPSALSQQCDQNQSSMKAIKQQQTNIVRRKRIIETLPQDSQEESYCSTDKPEQRQIVTRNRKNAKSRKNKKILSKGS